MFDPKILGGELLPITWKAHLCPIFKASIVAGFRGFQLPEKNRTQKAFQEPRFWLVGNLGLGSPLPFLVALQRQEAINMTTFGTKSGIKTPASEKKNEQESSKRKMCLKKHARKTKMIKMTMERTTAWKAKCPIFLGNFSPKT